MSEEEESKIEKSLDRIEKSLIGDFESQGLISKVHENTKRSKDNVEKIENLEGQDKKKLAKELAVALSIILIMAGIIVNLLK